MKPPFGVSAAGPLARRHHRHHSPWSPGCRQPARRAVSPRGISKPRPSGGAVTRVVQGIARWPKRFRRRRPAGGLRRGRGPPAHREGSRGALTARTRPCPRALRRHWLRRRSDQAGVPVMMPSRRATEIHSNAAGATITATIPHVLERTCGRASPAPIRQGNAEASQRLSIHPMRAPQLARRAARGKDRDLPARIRRGTDVAILRS